MSGYRGPIIDTHVHLQLDERSQMAGAEHPPARYLELTAEWDLRAAAVLVIAPRNNLERTRQLNDLALGLAADDSRWLPMCSVHPDDGDQALAEIDRVAKAGARGLKLHPNTQNFDLADDAVGRILKLAAAHGLPVLFDGYSPFDADQPGKFVQLSTTYPAAQIIIAHAHGPRFGDLLVYEVLQRYPDWTRNVWIDLSFAAPLFADSPYREHFAWVLRRVGVDRLLFATDFPLDQPDKAFGAIQKLGFAPDELQDVVHGNAAALFGVEL